MMNKLEQYGFVDEDHGILGIQAIKEICSEVFDSFNVDYCYLFGSYAKGKAVDSSDVDLLVSTTDTGMRFFDLWYRKEKFLEGAVNGIPDIKRQSGSDFYENAGKV
jgi:predicted nucleotidyltransferase